MSEPSADSAATIAVLTQRLQALEARQQILADAARRCSAAADLDTLLATVAEIATAALGAPCTLHLADERPTASDDQARPHVALRAAGRVVGALLVDGAASADQLALLGELADRAGPAIDALQARAQQVQASQRLERLQDVAAALGVSLDTAHVTAVMLEIAATTLGARAGAVLSLMPDGATVSLLASYGFSDTMRINLSRVALAVETVFTDSIRLGAPVYIRTAEERDARYPRLAQLRQSDDRAAAGLPLLVDQRAIGSFGLTFSAPQRFAADERAFFAAVAQLCAAALHRAQLYATLLEATRATDEAHTLLDTLFTYAPVGLAFVDHSLRFVRVNQALAEINGLPAADHLGQTLRVVLPQLAPHLEPLYRLVLDYRQPIVNQRISGETPSDPGRLRHWLVNYYPVGASDHAPIGVGVVVVEVTAMWEAEARARDSAATLQAIFESSAQSVILVDPDLQIIRWNQRAADGVLARFGVPLQAGVPLSTYMMPEMIAERTALLRRALAGERIATTLNVGQPDAPLWLNVDYTPVHDLGGRFLGICITTLDVTEAHLAQATLRDSAAQLRALSLRLVEAQEAERRMLAHELHDEIGQLLSGLNLVLEVGELATPAQIRTQLRLAQQVVTDLTSRVRQLSLDLRPSILDDLGLLPALLWHVRRYSDQTQLAVEFKHHGLDALIPPPIATATYRIVQESLTNIARHAAASAVAVQVWRRAPQLMIAIEDNGRGFDVAAALRAHDSVGLHGIRERVLLLGGTLTIDSTPGEGTRLLATLPLAVEQTAGAADPWAD